MWENFEEVKVQHCSANGWVSLFYLSLTVANKHQVALVTMSLNKISKVTMVYKHGQPKPMLCLNKWVDKERNKMINKNEIHKTLH